MENSSHRYSVAIACGGTGGHLFPGLAVAEKLSHAKTKVTLIVSRKEIDQQAISQANDCQVLAVPAVGLERGRFVKFLRGFRQSYLITKRLFRHHCPDAVIGMGGFTSAAPILAGKRAGARTFLHESNTIPGRANRWLSSFVDQAFVGFPDASARLGRCSVMVSGTPVRPQFYERKATDCLSALGLDPSRPMILVVGGSQGACGINQMVERCLPRLSHLHPGWQWLHLTGPKYAARMQAAYAKVGLRAVVHGFLDSMELAMGAATAAISRAGASGLAELAAMRVPALLIPYPFATDNHQQHNAQAYVDSGAAQVLEEKKADEEVVVERLQGLIQDQDLRKKMQTALARWQRPNAAGDIARHILDAIVATQARSFARRLRWPSPSRSMAFEADEQASSVLATPQADRSTPEQPVRI